MWHYDDKKWVSCYKYLLQDQLEFFLDLTQNLMQACMSGKTKIMRNTYNKIINM